MSDDSGMFNYRVGLIGLTCGLLAALPLQAASVSVLEDGRALRAGNQTSQASFG